MIASEVELEAAMRQLALLDLGLQELVEGLSKSNPSLLAASRGAYDKKIQELQREVAEYIHLHPETLSWMLRTGMLKQELAIAA